jgi:hypothetical protein
MINIAMVLADETKWCSYGQTRVLKIWGFNNNDEADRYIMLFNKPAAAIANGDVPAVKALWCGAEAAFMWPVEVDLSELSIAISSTEESYTAVTNTGLDLTAQIETQCPVTSVTTLSGDLTTGVADRQIWADASGPKRLLRLDVKNNAGGTAWARIFAKDSPVITNLTCYGPFKVLDTETKSFFFGVSGVTPIEHVPSATIRDGCTVTMWDTALLSASVVSTTDFNIRAIYE